MLLVPPHLTRHTGPNRRTAIRGLILRALVPGLVLWLAIAGFGELLTGPLKGWNRSESDLNLSLQDIRDRTWDSRCDRVPRPVTDVLERQVQVALGAVPPFERPGQQLSEPSNGQPQDKAGNERAKNQTPYRGAAVRPCVAGQMRGNQQHVRSSLLCARQGMMGPLGELVTTLAFLRWQILASGATYVPSRAGRLTAAKGVPDGATTGCHQSRKHRRGPTCPADGGPGRLCRQRCAAPADRLYRQGCRAGRGGGPVRQCGGAELSEQGDGTRRGAALLASAGRRAVAPDCGRFGHRGLRRVQSRALEACTRLKLGGCFVQS